MTEPRVDRAPTEPRVARPSLEEVAPFDLATTAASNPMPTWKRKYRPLTEPSPTRRIDLRPSASSNTPVASTGSSGSPRVRANTFVEPPGQWRQGGAGAGQTVGRFVEGAVAAEDDDHLGAGRGRALRQPGGVAAAAGLGGGDVVVGRQRLLDHDSSAGGDRRGRRVDEQQHLHCAGRYQHLRLVDAGRVSGRPGFGGREPRFGRSRGVSTNCPP